MKTKKCFLFCIVLDLHYLCGLKTKKDRKMRNLIIMLLVCLPMAAAAQGNWEKPDQVKEAPKKSTEYQYAKYLGNVVPEVNGEVVWEKTFSNNKNADENYAAMLNMLTAMTQEEIQIREKSNVSLVNKEEHKIICHFEEWLTFANTFINLDRTRFIYTLTADCKDNQVTVRILRVNYWYEENRNGGERYKAEEWITDKWALNKKKTRLAKISGKFRRKTVDRVEEIFNNIGITLGAQ